MVHVHDIRGGNILAGLASLLDSAPKPAIDLFFGIVAFIISQPARAVERAPAG